MKPPMLSNAITTLSPSLVGLLPFAICLFGGLKYFNASGVGKSSSNVYTVGKEHQSHSSKSELARKPNSAAVDRFWREDGSTIHS